MALKVNEQSEQVKAMSTNWPIAAALIGGTAAMRAAAKAYLPKQPNEDDEDWKYRLSVAVLFPAFARTLGVMAGKPFAKQLTFADDVPPKIKEWCDNCDLEGRNLHTFAGEMLGEVLGFGLAGVLVDYPRVSAEVKTLAAEKAIGARPYLVRIEHNQILGWKAQRVNGVMTLVQLRLAETAEVDDGDYGVITVDRVRVLTPGAWELWQKGEKDDYVMIDGGTTTLDAIPFVPFYGRRTGFVTGLSPLLDLAYLNVEHWQESSDQKDGTRFARKRLLVFSGADNTDGEVTIGSNYAVKLPQGATAEIVQGSSESVSVGRTELDALEKRMIQTGAELLVPQPGQRSATEANNDAEANKSELQRIVEQFEDSLDQCLQYMADWARLGQGGHVSVFKDFGAATLTDASAQLIVSMQQGGLITKETAIREQQRRGMLAPDIDPQTELEAVADEGPALGTLE